MDFRRADELLRGLALLWAGLLTPQAYLDSMAALITEFEQRPGRAERSIEETSWDTWFRASGGGDTNLANTNFSYYDGGQIAGHLLNFAIRQATGNQKSLDDWMRLLYQRYALPKPGFEPEDAVRAANEVAGKDMSEFFRRYISGKEPLAYETYFGYAGIRVERLEMREQAWIAVSTTRGEDGRARISNITPGSPAEAAGLDRGDTIVAVDGKTVDQTEFGRAVEARKAGEMLRLSLIRLGELKEIAVTAGANPYTTFRLRPAQHPTEMQQKIYGGWMGRR